MNDQSKFDPSRLTDTLELTQWALEDPILKDMPPSFGSEARARLVRSITAKQETSARLLAQLKTLQIEISKEMLILSSMRLIPPEILSHIFCLMPPFVFPHDAKRLLDLMLVSKRWRECIISTPCLWGDICIDQDSILRRRAPPLELLADWFSRAKQTPLHLSIQKERWLNVEICSIIAKDSFMCRSLKYPNIQRGLDLFTFNHLLEGSVLTLRSLEFGYRVGSDSRAETPAFDIALPELRRLAYPNFEYSWFIYAPRLEELEICPSGKPISANDLQIVQQWYPTIKTLKLTVGPETSGILVGDDGSYKLPNLTTVICKVGETYYINLIPLLTGSKSIRQLITPLRILYSRIPNYPSLRRLELTGTDYWLGVGDLRGFFRNLPSLEYLSSQCACDDTGDPDEIPDQSLLNALRFEQTAIGCILPRLAFFKCRVGKTQAGFYTAMAHVSLSRSGAQNRSVEMDPEVPACVKCSVEIELDPEGHSYLDIRQPFSANMDF